MGVRQRRVGCGRWSGKGGVGHFGDLGVGDPLPGAGLLDRARRFVTDNTTRVSTYDEFKRVMTEKRGFLVAGWCRSADCEAKIKEETKATVRVIPIEGTPVAGACVRCGQPSSGEVYFAQAY